MKTINFVAQSNTLNVPDVNGVFVQFDNHKGTISFEHPLYKSKTSDTSFDLKQNVMIASPLNFIASFIQRISPDNYNEVVVAIDGRRLHQVDIIHSNDNTKKSKMKTVYQISEKNFSSDVVNQKMISDINGDKLSLKEILGNRLKSVNIPDSFKYTKNPVINNILGYNNVPADVDRGFIKTLNHIMYRVGDTMHEKKIDTATIVISRNKKAGFFFDKRRKYNPKVYMVLTVKLSHFVY